MTLSLNNLTFIIVTFKSDHIINECIKSLPKDSNIIIIENSNNRELKKKLEVKYSKINVITQENSGMGSANNKGIKLCKTDYAFVINPDVKFYENTMQELIALSSKYNDYSILAPISDDTKYPNYKIKNKKIKNDDPDFLNVDFVDGYAMLINKKKFSDNIYFDENFFLYLENDDLCLRKKKENNKIYIAKKAKIHHLGGKSHSINHEKEIEFSRNWHWMWSKFYFNKKHYGYPKALLKSLPTLITSIIKFFYYFLICNKFKRKIYVMRFLGLINSMFGKKSWYRPQI
ncbi:glycosyltransferase family 2 protein [Candidatus Pelagibacter sp. Uisw_137]|uniref:glycosyltransferase family 2 protein n=1 Tax=Candidatus Pelagibacter sp. Uisw_137 TaxID=3230992 RepID=UPI0039E7A8A0